MRCVVTYTVGGTAHALLGYKLANRVRLFENDQTEV